MIRIAQVIGIKPEIIEEYTRLHAEVWPTVLERIAASNIRNYSIFLRRPENLLFAYMEYHGDDWEADTASIAADPETRRWWEITDPMQVPLESREKGEWWAGMTEVFHTD